MSARAAWRLELAGFDHVFRYEAGKMDWAASGHAIEGRLAKTAVAASRTQADVPTCHPGERLGAVRNRVRAAGADFCVVINDERVVLGRLRREAWNAPANSLVEQVMEEGPTTIRPDTNLDDIAMRMLDRDVDSVLVSDPDGRLMGVLYRKYAQASLSEAV